MILKLAISVVFGIMAVRAWQSASQSDCILAAAQLLGVIAMLVFDTSLALYFLLVTCAAYLLSQVLTGARVISYVLPLASAGIVGLYLWEF